MKNVRQRPVLKNKKSVKIRPPCQRPTLAAMTTVASQRVAAGEISVVNFGSKHLWNKNLKQNQCLKLDAFGHTLEYFGVSLDILWSTFGVLLNAFG
jgi:hypothetical protein